MFAFVSSRRRQNGLLAANARALQQGDFDLDQELVRTRAATPAPFGVQAMPPGGDRSHAITRPLCGFLVIHIKEGSADRPYALLPNVRSVKKSAPEQAGRMGKRRLLPIEEIM